MVPPSEDKKAAGSPLKFPKQHPFQWPIQRQRSECWKIEQDEWETRPKEIRGSIDDGLEKCDKPKDESPATVTKTIVDLYQQGETMKSCGHHMTQLKSSWKTSKHQASKTTIDVSNKKFRNAELKKEHADLGKKDVLEAFNHVKNLMNISKLTGSHNDLGNKMGQGYKPVLFLELNDTNKTVEKEMITSKEAVNLLLLKGQRSFKPLLASLQNVPTAITTERDGVSTTKVPTAITTERDGVPTTKVPTAITTEREGVSTTKVPTAITTERDGVSTTKVPTAITTERDGVPTTKVPTAITTERQGVPMTKVPTAITTEREGVSTTKVPTAITTEREGVPRAKVPSAITTGGLVPTTKEQFSVIEEELVKEDDSLLKLQRLVLSAEGSEYDGSEEESDEVHDRRKSCKVTENTSGVVATVSPSILMKAFRMFRRSLTIFLSQKGDNKAHEEWRHLVDELSKTAGKIVTFSPGGSSEEDKVDPCKEAEGDMEDRLLTAKECSKASEDEKETDESDASQSDDSMEQTLKQGLGGKNLGEAEEGHIGTETDASASTVEHSQLLIVPQARKTKKKRLKKRKSERKRGWSPPTPDLANMKHALVICGGDEIVTGEAQHIWQVTRCRKPKRNQRQERRGKGTKRSKRRRRKGHSWNTTFKGHKDYFRSAGSRSQKKSPWLPKSVWETHSRPPSAPEKSKRHSHLHYLGSFTTRGHSDQTNSTGSCSPGGAAGDSSGGARDRPSNSSGGARDRPSDGRDKHCRQGPGGGGDDEQGRKNRSDAQNGQDKSGQCLPQGGHGVLAENTLEDALKLSQLLDEKGAAAPCPDIQNAFSSCLQMCLRRAPADNCPICPLITALLKHSSKCPSQCPANCPKGICAEVQQLLRTHVRGCMLRNPEETLDSIRSCCTQPTLGFVVDQQICQLRLCRLLRRGTREQTQETTSLSVDKFFESPESWHTIKSYLQSFYGQPGRQIKLQPAGTPSSYYSLQQTPARTRGSVTYGERYELLEHLSQWHQQRRVGRTQLQRSTDMEAGVILNSMKNFLTIDPTSLRYTKDREWCAVVPLGSGMSGHCSLALDLQTQTKFCVKEVQIWKLECSEIEILTRLDHRNICHCYGAIFDGEYVYILLEFIEGVSLCEQLKRVSRLNARTAMVYFKQLIEVLIYLRQQMVLHEDIKSDNIILRARSSQLVLIDFGLVRQLSSQNQSVPRNEKAIGGSTQWSPQKAEGIGYSYEADLWAATCVLNEMLCGRPPWIERYPFAHTLIYKIVTESPPLEDIADDTPPELRDLIELLWRGTYLGPAPNLTSVLNHSAFCIIDADQLESIMSVRSFLVSGSLRLLHQPIHWDPPNISVHQRVQEPLLSSLEHEVIPGHALQYPHTMELIDRRSMSELRVGHGLDGRATPDKLLASAPSVGPPTGVQQEDRQPIVVHPSDGFHGNLPILSILRSSNGSNDMGDLLTSDQSIDIDIIQEVFNSSGSTTANIQDENHGKQPSTEAVEGATATQAEEYLVMIPVEDPENLPHSSVSPSEQDSLIEFYDGSNTNSLLSRLRLCSRQTWKDIVESVSVEIHRTHQEFTASINDIDLDLRSPASPGLPYTRVSVRSTQNGQPWTWKMANFDLEERF